MNDLTYIKKIYIIFFCDFLKFYFHLRTQALLHMHIAKILASYIDDSAIVAFGTYIDINNVFVLN